MVWWKKKLKLNLMTLVKHEPNREFIVSYIGFNDSYGYINYNRFIHYDEVYFRNL